MTQKQTGQPMELFAEKTEDVGKEKHVPVIENKLPTQSLWVFG